jgi:hypothetical protein
MPPLDTRPMVLGHLSARNKAAPRSARGGKIKQNLVGVNSAVARGNGEIVKVCSRRWIAFGLFLAAPVLFAQAPAAQTPAQAAQTPAKAPAATPAPTAIKHHKSQKPQKEKETQKELVLPPLPSGPLSQLPMDQIPATPATVSYDGGMLTISAQNSTLGEILRDVRKLTGASIDIPPNATERVVTHLGPGAPRDVLAVLLNGSAFNYVMLGSNTDPTAVSSIVLLPKSTSGETQSAANGNPAPMPPNRLGLGFNSQAIVRPGMGQPANAEAADSKDEPDADDNADDQTQPPPGQPAPADANAQPDQPQQPDANQPNAGPKTPEQILEMLRRPQQPTGAAPANPQQPPQQQ